MTTDEKKEFARLNAGRRVTSRVAGTGTICAFHDDGTMVIGIGASRLTGERWTPVVALPTHGGCAFSDEDFRSLVPIDNLGPLLLPEPHTKQTPHGAVVTPAGNRCGWVNDSGDQCMKPVNHLYGHAYLMRQQPPAADPYALAASDPKPLPGRLHERGSNRSPARTAPDLKSAATAALIFLCEEVPLPGCSKERERKLLEVVRNLKASLRGAK